VTVTRTWGAAALGAASAIPFLVMNALVAHHVAPVVQWLRPAGSTGAFELVVLAVLVMLLLAGAIVAIAPVLARRVGGVVIVPNVVVALLLLTAFVAFMGSLGSEIVACEVRHLAHCD
jgi:hypothetical protein